MEFKWQKLRDVMQLRRTASAVTKSALLFRGAAILCVGLVSITSIAYAVSYFYDQYGSFTVSLNKYDMMKQGVSLSETPEFSGPISRLNADIVKDMYNISGLDLPEDVDEHDGGHNGSNYIAYTFYLKNTGQDTVTYQASMETANVTRGIDEAIRIRLYTNGESVDYAKPKADGTPERGTTPFAASNTVLRYERQGFSPGDMDKFTVVIWLEGDDPDCVDDIIGGSVKIEFNFKIVESS